MLSAIKHALCTIHPLNSVVYIFISSTISALQSYSVKLLAMYTTFLLLIALFSVASAFFHTASKVRSLQLNAKSKALPFLEAPSKLDGSAVGDFGFDPLGFTDTLSDMSYVRASELKHGIILVHVNVRTTSEVIEFLIFSL